MRGWRPSPCSCSTTTCQRSLPWEEELLLSVRRLRWEEGAVAPSLIPSAEDPSRRGLLRVRPQGGLASAQTTYKIPFRGGYHCRLFLFPCFLFQSLGNVLSPPAVRPNPPAAKAPAFAPVLVMATLAAELQDSTLSDPRVAVDLRAG